MDEALDLSLPTRKDVYYVPTRDSGPGVSQISSPRTDTQSSFSETMRLPTKTAIESITPTLFKPTTIMRKEAFNTSIKDNKYLKGDIKIEPMDLTCVSRNVNNTDPSNMTEYDQTAEFKHSSSNNSGQYSPQQRDFKPTNSFVHGQPPHNSGSLNNIPDQDHRCVQNRECTSEFQDDMSSFSSDSPGKQNSSSEEFSVSLMSDNDVRTASPIRFLTSPSMDSVITKTVSGITITLDESELWNIFRKNGTEMIINRNGRRMFPHLDLSIQGLNPTQLYNILLEICPADGNRYKFISNKWTPMGIADPMVPNPPVLHHDSPNIGSFWMRKLSFAKIKLTNHKDVNQDGMIVLQSMHKYMINVIIESAGSDGQGLHDRVVIPLEETAFYAVTAYQNETIIQLKIHNNPFAKAFRENRATSKSRANGYRQSPNSLSTGEGEKLPNKRSRHEHLCKKKNQSTNISPPQVFSPIADSSKSFQNAPIQAYFGINGLPYMPFGGLSSYPLPPFLPHDMLYPTHHWIQSEQFHPYRGCGSTINNTSTS